MAIRNMVMGVKKLGQPVFKCLDCGTTTKLETNVKLRQQTCPKCKSKRGYIRL